MYSIKLELKLNNKERSLMAGCAGYARFVYNYGLNMVNGTKGMTKVTLAGVGANGPTGTLRPLGRHASCSTPALPQDRTGSPRPHWLTVRPYTLVTVNGY